MRPRWSAYPVALVCVAIAVSLRVALDPWLGDFAPAVFVFGAIAVAAWLGGFRPALLAAITGYAATNYLFIAPRGELGIAGTREMMQLLGYAVSALVIAGLGGVMHRARARIEESEQRFRSFMQNSPNYVFLKGEDGRFVFVNRAVEALIGTADWLGKRDADLVAASAAREIEAHDREVLASDAARSYELALPLPAGERRLYSTKFPLRDAQGRRYIGSVGVDITEQRRSEQELQLVTDTMSAAVIRCAADTRVLWANRVYCQWMARRLDEIAGRPLVEVIGAAALEEIRAPIARVLRGEQARYERLVDYPGLGRRWMAAVYSPTFDAGRATGWVAVVYDIHERKTMEEALAASNRRKDEFLAMLAHELRNPLAPIRNAVAILGRDGELAPELAWSRDVIGRQVEQMGRLIDDLLDIARISSGKLLLRRRPATLASVIEMALETSRPHIDAGGHRLAVRLEAAGDAWLDADATRLAQVFSNLLNNAAKYTPAGGRIAVTAAREGDRLAVLVEDSGAGFPPEAALELFEPFSQRAAADDAGGGLGIGLALVRGIVQLHGGSVEAQSDGPGRGSRFVVRLPLGEGVARPAEERTAGAPRGSAVRVLVADDNRDAADSLARILALYGHDVRVAYDGAEALAVAAQFRPRAAILDIGMPRVNGYEVAARLRESRGGEMTLIAATGWGQEADRRRALEAGFDHHLTKPVDPKSLSEILDACS